MMSLLQTSITAGILVIVVIIIRSVALNHLPKKMFLILWGIVILQFLLPFSVPSQFSIYNAFERDTAVIAETTNKIIILAPQTIQNAPTTQSIDILLIVWLIGIFTVFIFIAVTFIKNQRKLRFSTLISNDFLDNWLIENKATRITILQSNELTTPVTIGIFRPRIILPSSMDMKDHELLQYVLAHECYHIRRLDVLWKLIATLAVCVHWFNPMAWVTLVLLNRDLEITCDEAVVRRFGAKTKTAYAYSLIAMAQQKGKFTPFYNGFCKNAAEERIVAIMKYNKSTVITTILAVLLVTGTTTAFATSGLSSNLIQNTKSPKTLNVITPPTVSEPTITVPIEETEPVVSTTGLTEETKLVVSTTVSTEINPTPSNEQINDIQESSDQSREIYYVYSATGDLISVYGAFEPIFYDDPIEAPEIDWSTFVYVPEEPILSAPAYDPDNPNN